MEKINRANALRYMGFPSEEAADEKTLLALSQCERELLKAARPKYIYRIFGIERRADGLLLSECGVLLRGKSISEHLSGFSKAAVVCTTLGAGADKFISREQLRGAFYGLCADALASSFAEQMSDDARKEIEKKHGLYSNFIFAAGYGDFPLETAALLLNAVNAEKTVGVAPLSSGMLAPLKSIVGVMGLSEKPPQRAEKSCELCAMKENCEYRKNGGSCD